MKRSCAVLAFILVLCCFCSCGSQLLVQPVIAPQSNVSSEEIVREHKMTLVTASSGLVTNEIAPGDNAFYTLRGYVDATADLIKYDLDTMQIEKFTAEAIPDILGGGIVATAGDYLLVFKLGHVPFADIYEGMSSKLYILDQAGALLHTVTLPAQQLFKSNSAVAYDGLDTIFVILSTFQDGEEHPVCVGEEVCGIRLSSGTITSLQSLPTSPSTIITDVYPDGLVMTAINNAATRTVHARLSQSLLPIYESAVFSTAGSSSALDVLDNASTFVSDGNGTFYFVEQKETALKSYDLSTGETSVVVDDLNILKDDLYVPYIMGDMYDRHLVVRLDNGLEAIDLFVDLNTKSIVDSPSSLSLDSAMQPAEIVYEGEAYLIVKTGITYIETTQYGGGNAYTFDECIPQFRAIPKEQYWLRSTSYLYFTDLVYSVQP